MSKKRAVTRGKKEDGRGGGKEYYASASATTVL